MHTQTGNLWLTPTWGNDVMPMSQFDNAMWESMMQTLDTTGEDIDGHSFSYLPPSIDSLSDTDGAYSTYGSPDDSPQTFDDSLSFLALQSEPTIIPGDLSASVSDSPAASIAMSHRSPQSSSGSDSGFADDTSRAKTRTRKRTSTEIATPKMRGSSNGVTKPKRARRQSTISSVDDSPELQRARSCHNVVEKNYRNRLNRQFELLLTTVTETRANGQNLDDVDGEEMGAESMKDYDGALSKSAVLQLARQTLLSLERANRQLSREVERLRGNEFNPRGGLGFDTMGLVL